MSKRKTIGDKLKNTNIIYSIFILLIISISLQAYTFIRKPRIKFYVGKDVKEATLDDMLINLFKNQQIIYNKISPTSKLNTIKNTKTK